MKWPRITIVTPTFNRTEWLEETILSVLNQDYPNLEYIIVDGGSTNPELFALIRKYEKRLAWWCSEPDRGHAEAIRKGFDRSSGEIMNWLCSDDTLLPGCLHAVAETFIKHPEAEVVFGHYSAVDGCGLVRHNGRVVSYHRLIVLGRTGFHQASVYWKRSLYDRAGGQVGGRNLEYAVHSPDVDLFMRFSKHSSRWVKVDRVLSTFRVHPTQTSTRERELCDQRNIMALQEHFPYWAERPGFRALLVRILLLRRYILMLIGRDRKYLYYKLRSLVEDH
jgi:glycosyltransferase involved in cell wall biosynthesis